MLLAQLNITPNKIKQFNNKGIYSAEQLVTFLPRKYNDYTKETGILPESEISCLIVRVNRVKVYNKSVPMMIAFCTVQPTGESLLIKWFNQNYLRGNIENCINRDVYVAGRVVKSEEYNNYSITSPDLFEANISKGKKICPVYPKIEGMSTEYLTSKINTALSFSELTAETCPPEIIDSEKLMCMRDALYQLHFPQTMETLKKAQERLLFDDLLYFAMCNEWAMRNTAIGSPYSIKTLRVIKELKDLLPYELTSDQQSAINAMVAHVREGKRLNALVQGDVGCGKSIVAFVMMALFADSQYQAVLMAPTQVLAKQHYTDLCNLMEPLGFRVVYLGGTDQKKSEKLDVLAEIEDGTADLIVGTHAVIGKNVKFKNLALTITDEEHKFGVAQREALHEKASIGVHSITMSATPIPRSLAQVLYGNSVQLQTIRTMPGGRKPVITGLATSKQKLFNFIISQARKGKQTYVVCPMIDQNEDMHGLKSVEEVSEEYRNVLEPEGLRIGTLTGRNSSAEAMAIIDDFKAGNIDVLISTTVIEVGVNVPTATTMVITNAERFGLASLHQLRGRVGRSQYQSYCVLECENPTPEARLRLDAMVRTTDGFEIAEEDLKIRGAGDFIGTRQSGENKYMALVLAYPEVYARAQKISKELLDRGTHCKMLSRVQAELLGAESGAS